MAGPTGSKGSPGDAGPPARPLRIGIEAHVVDRRPTGNGRVVANLIPSMAAVSEHEIFAYFTDETVAAGWRRRAGSRVNVRLVRPRHPLARIPIALPMAARRDRLDVFLAHDNRPPVSPCPVVTLIHDVAFARYPQYFSRYERLWMNRTIPLSLRHSAGIVAVSNFTRDEIVSLYGIPSGRITVAHNGIDPVFLDPTPRPSPFEPPFFLAAGSLQPRKNLATLIRGYRALLSADPALPERLVIVGQPSYQADSLMAEARDLLERDRLSFAGYLPDEELAGLLQRATAFAYPSVYEGFGLPPVEAMAAGAPALVSDIPVMREVVGDAALLIPARDEGAWADALSRLAGDPALRQELILRGRARAGGYSWEAAAREVLRALERAAG